MAKAIAVSSDAVKQAAEDALEIATETQDQHPRIAVQTHEDQDAILNASAASATVNPALHHAGLHALCLRDAYPLPSTGSGFLFGPSVAGPLD